MNYLQQLQPLDELNQAWQEQVHPADWKNPTPSGRYNLVVIGAGTAGLVTAAGAAGLGAKVALVERGLLGGDCLNFGCVPSKAIISAALQAAAVRGAHRCGVHVEELHVNFGEVMHRMRRLRATISPHDSAAQQGIQLASYTQPLASVDRAMLDGEDDGFVRVHYRRGSDKILGATIVAARAGDLIGEVTLAMKHKIGLKNIGATIHPYPTQAELRRGQAWFSVFMVLGR